MVIREVVIVLKPATFLHITMVDYTLSTQGSLKNLFQGVFEEKLFNAVIKSVYYIHIKIILIVLIQACHNTLIQSCHHTLIQICHHTLCSCPCCTSYPMYAPYGVSYHLHIPSLGYLNHQPPSIIPSSMSSNLLTPHLCPRSSRRMSEQMRKISNQKSNLM